MLSATNITFHEILKLQSVTNMEDFQTLPPANVKKVTMVTRKFSTLKFWNSYLDIQGLNMKTYMKRICCRATILVNSADAIKNPPAKGFPFIRLYVDTRLAF